MPSPLGAAIRALSDHHHTQRSGNIGNRADNTRQDSKNEEAENDRRDSFDEEQTLTAGKPRDTMQIQENTGDRSTDNTGNCCRRHKTRNGAAARGRGEPIRQVKNHAREKSGLSDAEQKTESIK